MLTRNELLLPAAHSFYSVLFFLSLFYCIFLHSYVLNVDWFAYVFCSSDLSALIFRFHLAYTLQVPASSIYANSKSVLLVIYKNLQTYCEHRFGITRISIFLLNFALAPRGVIYFSSRLRNCISFYCQVVETFFAPLLSYTTQFSAK